MIKLENISKVYKVKEPAGGTRDFYALRGVSLDIPEGSIYGVIGRSGAGKSTLIRCVNLLERPTSGRVTVGGVEMTSLSERELRVARRKIGMIFQQFNLLANRTVYRNIAFPLELERRSRDEIDARVREIAALVEIDSKLDHYPSQLSGGQKQRVGIARALANHPDVLLSDEATSALDPQTTKSVLRLLRGINERLGLTVALITHEMNVIKEVCDGVAVLDAGEIAEEGPALRVFSAPRSAAARDMLRSVADVELPDGALEGELLPEPEAGADMVLRLSMIGGETERPIISELAIRCGANVSILAANINRVGGTPCGGMIVRVSADDTHETLEYMLDNGVRAEVMGYVRRSS